MLVYYINSFRKRCTEPPGQSGGEIFKYVLKAIVIHVYVYRKKYYDYNITF